ncbi:MAG: hypothetical protein ACP5JG_09600 [Anaerolineae bacterium]
MTQVVDDLANVAAETMDFDAVERERLERDGDLQKTYVPDLPRASGNLYLFPDGRVVNVDDAMLSEPTALTDDPASAFSDGPGKPEA